jgi:hypothetical protein
LKMITYGPNCSNSSTLRPNKKVLKQPWLFACIVILVLSPKFHRGGIFSR